MYLAANGLTRRGEEIYVFQDGLNKCVADFDIQYLKKNMNRMDS